VGVEIAGAVGRPTERGERDVGELGILLVRDGVEGLEVVVGDDAGELDVAGGCKGVGHLEVAGAAVVAGQAGVGDLADEALDEPVLATFG
jgi:hypothetical protein